MESEIINVREQLDKAVKDADLDIILECLKKAQNFKVTKDILKTTEIGKSVGKLRVYKDIGISKESKSLIEKWKQDIEGTTATTPNKSTKSLKSTETTATTSSPGQFKRKSSYESILTDLERPNKKVVEEKPVATTPVSTTTSPKLTSSGTLISSINPIKGANADLRNKSIQLFVESLAMETDDTISSPEDVAIEIEAELFEIYRGVTADYKAKLRSFKFNLKKNDSLRLSLLNRQLGVCEFCSMDVMAMASDELKEERKKLDKFNTEASMLGTNNEATTDQFLCGKCKQRKCTYTQLQTRSADEPPTTFVRCCNCGNRWRFC